jgi:type IV pilus assembly protein PilC
MSRKDLIFWLTQLSTYVKSGVPLTDATKILAEQDKRKKYSKIYDELIYELTMGESFAKALEKQSNVFPALLVNMIKAAEMMGEIEYTLDDMAEYYSSIESTKKEMKSAMTYPVIVSVFSLAIVIFILTYVIPQFEDVYAQAGVEMNGATLLVLNASYFIKSYWIFMILGVVGTVSLVVVSYKNIKAFKTIMQYFLMHMPVIGKIMIYNEMVLFSKTFSSLQKNNVLLTESIDILSKITDNEIYKVIMFDTITNLLKGDKMSDSFKDNWAIPELAYYMISTGERTGDLAAMLDKVAKYYQEQQKAMVNTLKAFIEPIMIASLAIVVGGIIIAAIVPMFGMYGQLM